METRQWDRSAQRGYTLLSVLVALAIIGAALMILLSALSTTSRGVSAVNARVVAENLSRAQMEAIKGAEYRANPTTQPYPTIALPSAYSMTIEIDYWVLSTFQSSVPTEDQGLQRIEIETYAARRPGSPVFVLQGYKGDR